MPILETGRSLRALIVDDSEDDTLLIACQLRRVGFNITYERVDTAVGLEQALETHVWDIVIADHSMPCFNSLEALQICKRHGRDVPFIIVSGSISEETAIRAMNAGAQDYVLKDSLKRLAPAVERELREAEMRRAQRQAEEQARQQARDLQRLESASQKLMSQSDETATLHAICRLAVDISGSESACIELAASEETVCPPISITYTPSSRASGCQSDADVRTREILGRALCSGLPVILHRQETSTTIARWPVEWQDYRSVLSLPIFQAGEPIGFLALFSRHPQHFTPDRIRALQSFTNLAVVALQKARLYEQVHTAHGQMRSLSSRLLEAQETERRHIACELHDEIGQTLTVIKIGLQGLPRAVEGAHFADSLQENIALTDYVLDQVRNLALDLRPSLLDDLGLVAALRWFLDRRIAHTGLRVRLSAYPETLRLSSDRETVCFRVVQAALTNILRHAQAGRVAVLLRRYPQEDRLIISDNGIGFDVQAARAAALQGRSLGLLAMEERAHLSGGRLEIRSKPGRGTVIRVAFPNQDPPAGQAVLEGFGTP